MRTRIPLLLAGACAFAPALLAAQNRAAAPAPRSAPSTWDARFNDQGEELEQTTVNRTFTFAPRPGGEGGWLLLAQEARATLRSDREGVEGRVRATAYGRGGRGYERMLWTVEADGSEGGVEDEHYWILEPGCCATLPTRHYFALATGRRAFAATSPLALLPGQGEETRRVAYLGAGGTVRAPEFEGARAAIGMLQYAVDDSVRQRLLVISADDELGASSPALEVVSGTGRGGARAADTLRVRFGGGREARIPITANGFAAAGAQLPAGVSLRMAGGAASDAVRNPALERRMAGLVRAMRAGDAAAFADFFSRVRPWRYVLHADIAGPDRDESSVDTTVVTPARLRRELASRGELFSYFLDPGNRGVGSAAQYEEWGLEAENRFVPLRRGEPVGNRVWVMWRREGERWVVSEISETYH